MKTQGAPQLAPQPFRAALAAFVGTMIEWYDFYCYGTAAALVFGSVFFATSDPFVGTLASLGTFAVGFVARPFGALVFGHIGDRIGRKRGLIVTLTLMGAATTLIGLLPTYRSIGVWAVVLLVILRLLQGVAVGGEWGGAVLIAAEHAPLKWRTFLASAPQYGSPIGLVLATLIFGEVAKLPKADFMDWGWRIPFIVSGVLVIVALVIRRGVNESPELVARLERGHCQEATPLIAIFRSKKKSLMLGIGLCLLGISGFYFITTLMITLTTTFLSVARADILEIITWVGVVELFGLPVGAYCAYKIGERKYLMLVTAMATLWSVPMMMLILSGDLSKIAVGILVATVFIAGYYSVLAPYLPKAFPVEMRYTGISLSFQLCAAFFGGTTPLVGLWVVRTFGVHWLPLSLLFVAIAGGTFLSAVFLPTSSEEPEAGNSALSAIGAR